ncbi:hypothetical protein [Rhodopirellula halodulae]|uniref:hypothetical protein n=1 Tax=Rhodopirellula halodulae TaxID=2894198 RepID=UPI001E37F1AF|nr:hypothetical protein [Rhodopirellula sp. JC737]MCC9658750.1 hypothetical protein [Rhodopirellula sp. JC737]
MRHSNARDVWLLLGGMLVGWVVMIESHEFGHLIGGWVSGATLVTVDLAPWRLPYSIHAPDPNPLVTLWAGPVLGVLVPVTTAMLLGHRFAWFLANFCLLANGTYMAVGWFAGDAQLDSSRLLQNGTPAWLLGLYCFATIPLGYHRFRRDCIHLLSPAMNDRSDDAI